LAEHDVAALDEPVSDRDPSRVHWMELFFDLIFVALVGQLAHGLHEHPGVVELLIFLALFGSVWWAWVNLTFAVNIMPELSRRQLSVIMLAAMFAIGAIAVAAPEATRERAWLFAAGNALIRILLLTLWVRFRWATGSRWRVVTYNGATAVLWLVSIGVPAPAGFILWAVAIMIEIALLLGSTRAMAALMLDRVNIEHLTERFGLLVIIVLGESVLSTVATLNEHWTLSSGLTSALGLVIASLLAWAFFIYSAEAMREGLEGLRAARNFATIRDTVGFLPFLLVAGVTVISGALAVAISDPEEALPPASAISLGGGIALFYATNAIISLRFGAPVGRVLRWALPAVVLPVALVFVGLALPARWTIVAAVMILLIVVTSTEVSAHRHLRA
jgi:low temperature requirement protein LtrA